MLDSTRIGFPNLVCHDESYVDSRGRSVQRDFFDRETAWAALEPLLFAPTPAPAIVMGERRAGKTSLLRLIETRLDRADHNFVVVFISYMGVSSMDSLRREIFQNLEIAIGTRLPDRGQAGTVWEREFDLSTPFGLIRALQRMLTPDFDGTFVLCIDELDSILERVPLEEAHRILGFVHGLVESAQLPLHLIVSMTRVPEMMMSGASPLVTRALQVPLSPFSERDLRDMVGLLLAGEVALTDAEYARLYELSGGWPYFAKLILVYLEPGDDDRIEQAVQRAIDDLGVSDTMKHIFLHHWTDDERAIVLALAYFGGYLSPRHVAALDARHRSAVQQLARRHFVLIDAEQGCRFEIGFLAYWFPRWHRFEIEVERRAGDVVERLTACQDADVDASEDDYPIVTDEDMRKYGRWYS